MSDDERGESSDYSDGGDSWDDEEDLKDYRKGGYHPVKINDKYSQVAKTPPASAPPHEPQLIRAHSGVRPRQGRYQMMSKLGWGHF